MSWVKLILALVNLANGIFGWLHDRGLIKEGEDRAVARALAQMAARSTTIKEIDERFARMSPEDVTRYLDQQGDFRD